MTKKIYIKHFEIKVKSFESKVKINSSGKKLKILRILRTDFENLSFKVKVEFYT